MLRFRPDVIKKWVEDEEISFVEENAARMRATEERILRRAADAAKG